MISFLQQLLVIASFVGACYAPFHYIDRFASDEAKARARSFIKAKQTGVSLKPLSTMLDGVFGRKHFTWRCFAISCAMSLLFTFIFLGIVNTYLINVLNQIERREEALQKLEKALDEAYPVIMKLSDAVIQAMESDKSEEGQRQLKEMKRRRADMERLAKVEPWTPKGVLLWMLGSIVVFLNFICDFVALGKTRLILRRIVSTDSRAAVGGYLLLDFLLALVIWTVSVAIFILLNTETYLEMSKQEPSFVAVVGVVSLATTIATSVWLYTFLLGALLSRPVHWAWQLFLRTSSGFVDPYDHPFKVIGIVGAPAITAVIALIFGAIYLLS